jgi:hypothetical protein
MMLIKMHAAYLTANLPFELPTEANLNMLPVAAGLVPITLGVALTLKMQKAACWPTLNLAVVTIQMMAALTP